MVAVSRELGKAALIRIQNKKIEITLKQSHSEYYNVLFTSPLATRVRGLMFKAEIILK